MSLDAKYSENNKNIIEKAVISAVSYTDKQKKEVELAIKKQKIWEKLNLYVNKEWHFHILNLLNREKLFFDQVKTNDPVIRQNIDDIEIVSRKNIGDIKRRFPILMENAFKNFKVPLDKNCRHPKYTLQNGFLKIEIDEQKGIAKLSDNEVLLTKIPADIDAILESVNREYNRLYERPFEGKKMFQILRRHYCTLIKNEKKSDGEEILIREIINLLKKSEKGFYIDEFIIDLTRLIDEKFTEVEGLRLELVQSKNTNNGIFLQGSMNIGYVGYIKFRKVA